MRRSLLLLLLLPNLLVAQTEFAKVWETKLSFDPRWTTCTPDLDYVLAVVLTDFQMLDGATGKTLWNYNFKEKHGVSKFERYSTHPENETVEVTIQKKGKDAPEETFFLDYRTGAVVGEAQLSGRVKEKTTRIPRSMRSRAVNQSSCTDVASNTLVDVGYDAKRFMNAKSGSDLNITVEASGGHSWKQNFTGRVVRHLTTDYLPADDGDVILNITSGQGRVFVVYEGITCLDLATGKLLWSSTFDNVQASGTLKVKQEIGRAAMPLIAADGVYICDFSKDERSIKKLDLTTGAVLWTADKLKKDDIVSELLVDGGNLIARFGGVIRVEQYIPGMDGKPDTYKVDDVFEGSTSIRAYDAATGKAIWNTEAMELEDNFKKSECSLISGDGRVMACGEKNIYAFDAANGKLLLQGDYNAKVIGKARWLYGYEGNYMVEGEKGIAQLKPDASVVYATNTGKCLMTEMRGEAFIVWTGKATDDRNEFIRFDPAAGKVMGQVEDCPRPRFNGTGDRFARFVGPKVTMFRTN